MVLFKWSFSMSCTQKKVALNTFLYLNTHFFHPIITALSQILGPARRGLLPADEADDGQPVTLSGQLPASLAPAQHPGGVLRLLGRTASLPDGAPDLGGL